MTEGNLLILKWQLLYNEEITELQLNRRNAAFLALVNGFSNDKTERQQEANAKYTRTKHTPK